MFGWLKDRRRKRLRAAPIPPEWLAWIEQNVPLHSRLSAEDQTELHGHVQVFLTEKYFEGCGGLELTDEIRVTIAAQACLLLLHRETDYYPRLVTILVYPNAYIARSLEHRGALVEEADAIRLGEAWMGGVAVLSWEDVVHGTSDVHDGVNVVLHEFAHLLDFEDGVADGTPPLRHRRDYASWTRVLDDAYHELKRDAALGRYRLLDPYGATNAAEFFAVATECFFEKPVAMRRRHPELYDELRRYFQQDPASREEN